MIKSRNNTTITKDDKHKHLLEAFERVYSHLEGEPVLDLHKNIKVGLRIRQFTSGQRKSLMLKLERPKEIDAVALTATSTWVLEIKQHSIMRRWDWCLHIATSSEEGSMT